MKNKNPESTALMAAVLNPRRRDVTRNKDRQQQRGHSYSAGRVYIMRVYRYRENCAVVKSTSSRDKKCFFSSSYSLPLREKIFIKQYFSSSIQYGSPP